MTIWPVLLLLEIFHDHLVYFVVIWYVYPRFGILYLEKSGNPVAHLVVLENRGSGKLVGDLRQSEPPTDMTLIRQ
jgi:hypothetical protein